MADARSPSAETTLSRRRRPARPERGRDVPPGESRRSPGSIGLVGRAFWRAFKQPYLCFNTVDRLRPSEAAPGRAYYPLLDNAGADRGTFLCSEERRCRRRFLRRLAVEFHNLCHVAVVTLRHFPEHLEHALVGAVSLRSVDQFRLSGGEFDAFQKAREISRYMLAARHCFLHLNHP